jgi:hypothetical protein
LLSDWGLWANCLARTTFGQVLSSISLRSMPLPLALAEYYDDEHSSECKLLIANEVKQACTQPRALSLFSLGVGSGRLQLFYYWDYAKWIFLLVVGQWVRPITKKEIQLWMWITWVYIILKMHSHLVLGTLVLSPLTPCYTYLPWAFYSQHSLNIKLSTILTLGAT